MPLGEGVPSNEEEKRSTPSKRRYFSGIGLLSMKMVADRLKHILVAHHDKR